MAQSHILGFPRIGDQRQLKKALERFWRDDIDSSELLDVGAQLRLQHWQWQTQAGLDYIPVGDFALYDHILQLCTTFNVVPARHQHHANELDKLFAMARGGQDSKGCNAAALEMTKWFDTNYHYLVPELNEEQQFNLTTSPLLDQIEEVKSQGGKAKPVVVGPLTFLWLSKVYSPKVNPEFDKLTLLPNLLIGYQALLTAIEQTGCEWVQIDEPILSLDLPEKWLQALTETYQTLAGGFSGKLLLVNYFGGLTDKLDWIKQTDIAGLHIDAVRAVDELHRVATEWPVDKVLSVGIVDGRNVWRADLSELLALLQPLQIQRGDNLWIAPSCSLLHVPVDADNELNLDQELRGWLSFARQKLAEVVALTRALNGKYSFGDRALFTDSDQVQRQRAHSPRIIDLAVRQRLNSVLPEHHERKSNYATRAQFQSQQLQLPALPTTTIGSFPQTSDIRKQRADFKAGRISQQEYDTFIEAEISHVIKRQQALELDVLVHGEPERNDMVEYFGELLQGVAVTQFGWVQSYGSRCVKPDSSTQIR